MNNNVLVLLYVLLDIHKYKIFPYGKPNRKKY